MFSSWTCSCFGARTHSVSFSVRTLKWICILIAHSLQCLRSRPQDTFPIVHPFPHSLTSLSLCLFSVVSVISVVSLSLSPVCVCVSSLSLLHFFPLRKSFFPPKISWAEPPVSVLLSAFLSFRLPPEWTFDLCFQHCRAFLAPSSKFFPGPPVTQFQEAKHHMVRITIAMTPVSVASFFVSSLSRGCDQIPDKVSLRKEWVSLRIHFIMAREPQYQDHR